MANRLENTVSKLLDSDQGEDAIVRELSNLNRSEREVVGKEGQFYSLHVEEASENPWPYVELKIVSSEEEYGILCVPEEHKDFFPPYRKQFVLNTDIKPFVMHSSGNKSSSSGEEEGAYICHPKHTDIKPRFRDVRDATDHIQGSFLRWFEHHEVKTGDLVRIYRYS